MSNALAKIDPRQDSLKSLFERSKVAIAQVVPKHLTADRILKVTLAATSRTPKLLECTQTSILQSVMQAAQLGLEPGGALGHAYLVPYKSTCQMIIGYRGLIELARRSGKVGTIEARAVYQRDKFRFEYGIVQVLEHEPFTEGDPGPLVAAYAIARTKGEDPQIEVMFRWQIEKVRAKSMAANNGPWVDHYDEMARKTVVRRLCKYLPLTVELAEAIEADDRRDTELDAGAFSAIPVDVQVEESPLATKLAERAAKKPEPDLMPFEAGLSEATDLTQLEAARVRYHEAVPMGTPGRDRLDSLYFRRQGEIK